MDALEFFFWEGLSRSALVTRSGSADRGLRHDIGGGGLAPLSVAAFFFFFWLSEKGDAVGVGGRWELGVC